MSLKCTNDTLAAAKTCVFRLLKIRFRSEKEIRDKLNQKGFSAATVNEAVSFFKRVDLIDDQQFARKWIASRLGKPWGIQRIRFELKQKGVAPEIIEQQWQQAAQDYSEDDVLAQLVRKQARKHSDIPAEKIKQRVYGYLLRRGFSSSSVMKAIKSL